ncbi:hypothetical protein L218DRAFT_1007985 [Marasmius fiardii PR-910]|nr:hypothetical protein L218DRAFT_1007985 [Marasmius fiardii PR-910]
MATTNPGQFVASFGSNTILNIVNLLSGAVFYGVYAVLFCAGIAVLCRHEGNVKARIGLLLSIATMFTLTSFCFWGNAAITFAGIQEVLVNNVEQPYQLKVLAFSNKFQVLSSVAEVMVPLEIVVGDFIVLWRVWALFAGNRKVVLIPLLFLIGSAVCSLAFLGCFAQHDWPALYPETCNSIVISAYALSMATNVSATILIGYKFWSYRQTVGDYLQEFNIARRQARAEKILILLLESGIIYSVLWVIQLVEILQPPQPTFSRKIAQQFFTAMSIQFVGIYPTLLIVLVYLQRSMWDSYGKSTLLVSSSTAEEPNGSRSTLVGKAS